MKISKRTACYHEAGHAVASIALGFPLRKVEVFTRPNIYGYCKRVTYYNVDPYRMNDFHMADMIVILAGIQAELLAAPRKMSKRRFDYSMRHGWVGDMQNAFERAAKFDVKSGAAAIAFRTAKEGALQLMERCWEAVRRVALALIRQLRTSHRATLTEHKLKQLIGDPWPNVQVVRTELKS